METRMAEATVHVKTTERAGGRVALVTVDNARKLNCLSTELNRQALSGVRGARR